MRIVIFTPVRLLGDSLQNSLVGHDNVETVTCVNHLPDLRTALPSLQSGAVLVDVTTGCSADELAELAQQFPAARWVTLGMDEQRGKYPFAHAHVPRTASVAQLYKALTGEHERRCLFDVLTKWVWPWRVNHEHR